MLVFVGLSHSHAPLDLRERCAVPPDGRARALASLRRRGLRQAVLLSTCGRVELYLDHPDADAAERLAVEWLAGRARVDRERIRQHVETAHGADAVRRVGRVACGLESAIEGEDEILGQVRRAWLDAGSAHALSPALNGAFRLAVRAGRQARRLGDPHAWTSLADTAAAHVALAVQDRATPRVVIAGSGPMGRRAARALRERFGATLELALAGRTPERVAAHADELSARALTLAEVPEALSWADAAVVGLRTTRALIGASDIAARPAQRPLLLVDLSVPRAVEGDAGAVAGVSLLDVDRLVAGEGRSSRWDAECRARVERLIDQAMQDFETLTQRTDAATTLAALRLQADGIRRAQLERTLRRLPGLDAEARWVIDALTRSIVNRVLHEPTLRLRADADGAVARQVQQLFGMAASAAGPTIGGDDALPTADGNQREGL